MIFLEDLLMLFRPFLVDIIQNAAEAVAGVSFITGAVVISRSIQALSSIIAHMRARITFINIFSKIIFKLCDNKLTLKVFNFHRITLEVTTRPAIP